MPDGRIAHHSLMSDQLTSKPEIKPAQSPPDLLNVGRRALVGALAGGAWIAWADYATHGYAIALRAAFIALASNNNQSRGRSLNLGFVIVTALEGLGVGLVIFAANKMQRFDLLPVGIGIVVGLHFFGLAWAFRTPIYNATAAAITAWSVASWMLFHGDRLTAAVGIGVGAILWATSSVNLTRALAAR